MACTPFPAPNAGLFENSTQGVWVNTNETKGTRSCTYSGGTLTVSAPSGSINFIPVSGQSVRHKFFGTGNFLAVLTFDTGGSFQRYMSIVDFTAPALTSKQILFVGASSTSTLPWLQNSAGSGTACLIGAPTPGGVAGLGIFRSDTGALLCAGPPPLTPNIQIIGSATATTVQIQDGAAIIAGPCPFPAGQLDVQPDSQTFTTVKLGGCAPSTSTKDFVLKNSGNDCLTISAIAASSPFSVTSQTTPFPAQLSAGQTMTVTVTFAPSSVGSFNNVNLAVTRTPAKGDDKLICSGQAQTAQPAFTATSVVNFGTVLVGTPANGSFTIKNTGDVPISVSVPPSTPGSPFQWSGFTGPLTCGQSQVIPVVFTPQVDGPVQTIVTVTSSPGGSAPVTLKGEGCIPNAVIVVPPAPFPAFGDVRQGYRMPRFITIQNAGDDTLTFTATISGPDAALFGIMKPSQSLTDVLTTRTYTIDPIKHCGGGPISDGSDEVAVTFFANAAPPKTATATLTIDNHNDATSPASFSLPLTGNVIAGNVVDAIAVIDTSGSMVDPTLGGGSKMATAIQAGKLFVNLIPPDLNNRVAATRFSTDATVFLPIGEVTSGNQQGKVDTVKDPPLTATGSTAIAAGMMTGLPEFAVPRAGPAPPILTKAMVVLTDGMDNTAFKNPADNKYYSLGTLARDPGNLSNFIPTEVFIPPSDVRIYAVGFGTGEDIDKQQLEGLSSGAGGYYGSVDPTQPAVTFQLMKFYTQIYMDLVDTSVIKDPKDTIYPGQKHVIEFDILQGDVSAIVVMYDFNGLRLPFWLESPAGEIVDASFVPSGFQLRSGFTETSRFIDFVLPWGDSKRYAGRWKLIVLHDGRVCRGNPSGHSKQIGFLPPDCGTSKSPVDYGFVIGVGSNFRLQAYVTPGPVNVGDPIRLTGVPTEAGLPVTGCSVTVDAVAPNGQTWTGIILRDDGAHDDGDSNDGEYARLFTNTSQAGSYSFTFRATGVTRDGEPVNRETIRSKYVIGRVKEPPPPRWPGGGPDRPPGGGDEDCCKKLVKLLEGQSHLLERILEAERKHKG
jgi:hypothetical protein